MLKRRPVLKFKKKFKEFFYKSLQHKTKIIKFKGLKEQYKDPRKKNIYILTKKALLKYSVFFKGKKQLPLHFIKIYLKRINKLNYCSTRELHNIGYLNFLFNKKNKKKINHEVYVYKNIYKLEKILLISLIQETKIKSEVINFKKKSSIYLLKLLKAKKILQNFVKIAPRYRLRIRTETYKNRFIKSNFYQDLMSKY